LRIVYIGRDGYVTVEKIADRYRFIDEPDGFHPIHKGVVYQDAEHKRAPIVVIWADQVLPQSFKPFSGLERTFFVETDFQKTHHRKPTYSLKGWRMAGEAMWTLARIGFFLGFTTCLVSLLYALVLILKGGP
jgi:hypothetical protein